MSVVNRLRGALAEMAPPLVDLDDIARAESAIRAQRASRRRRHGFVGVTVAVGTVVLFSAVAVLWRGSAGTTVRTTSRAPEVGPGHLLAIRTGTLVELSATTGVLERTLIGRSPRPVVALAASSDGEVAYVARPPVAGRFGDAFAVDRVDLRTGRLIPHLSFEPRHLYVDNRSKRI